MDKFKIIAACEIIPGVTAMQKFTAKRLYNNDEERTLDQWKRLLVKDGVCDLDLTPEKKPDEATPTLVVVEAKVDQKK